jgi:hypothetical protein
MIIKAFQIKYEIQVQTVVFCRSGSKLHNLCLDMVVFLGTCGIYHHISTEIDLGLRDHSDDDIMFRWSWGFCFKSNVLN